MEQEKKSLKDLPKVYGYTPFCDDEQPYILYDLGYTDVNGNPIYFDEDGESVNSRAVEACPSFEDVHRRYKEDVAKINSLKGFIQSYQDNYTGDDKFLPNGHGNESWKDKSIENAEKLRDKYLRAYKALKTGFFEVEETQYLVNDVVSITSEHKEGDNRPTTRIVLSLVNPMRIVHVTDESDIDLVILLFGANNTKKRWEYKEVDKTPRRSR
jgi:hypothetical protein